MAKEREYSIFFEKKCPSGVIEIKCYWYDDKQFVLKMLKNARREHPEYGIRNIFVRTYVKGENKEIGQEFIH